MDKIKALLHGTSPEEEREKKEEKKLEKETHSGEGSHLGSSSHNTTTNTSNVNPTTGGVAGSTGGLGHNTIKSDHHSTPIDGNNLTTHDRHAEREAHLGAGGVDVPHRARESEHHTTTGLSGVGNGSSNLTGSNTQAHGVHSASGGASNPLPSHTAGNTDSHHGRDAALGSGAALGAAELAHHSHGQHRNTHDNEGLGSGSGIGGAHQTHPGRDTALGTGAHGQHHDNEGLGSGISGTHQTHHGRDAALGTGAAVGAAELAHSSHGQHHNTHETHGLGSGIKGPHTTATANLLDPKVNPTGPTETAHTHHGHSGHIVGGGAEDADGDHRVGTSAGAGILGKREFEAGHTGNTTAGPHSSNLANKADPRVDSDLSKSQGHHYGRDAAVAGGLGATGATAAHGAGHHDNTTAVPHSSNLTNKADPRVDSDLSRSQDHHYGRDAALAGGVGAAGLGASHGHNTTTAGPHSSNLANKADPTVDSDLSRSQDHHYGRDAALAGGVGAAGLGAHQAGHSTHQNPNTLSSGTTGYGNTTAGPHSSNLANKADPRVDSDRSKDHHYGRDAAVAGGVGTAGYEANKHLGHNDSTTHSNTTDGPHSSNLANKADPRIDSDRSNIHDRDPHHGRDAALAGGVGAAGYEANKHLGHDNTHLNKTPLDQKPPGKDLGDHLHGVERNRGVPGETGFPHGEGHHHGSTASGTTTGLAHGRDPAVGTGVPGAPRGNVLKGEHEHGVQHNNGGLNGPEHLITAPVMNDPHANHDLVESGHEAGHHHGHEHGLEHGHKHGLDSEHGHTHGLESEHHTGSVGTGTGAHGHGHTAESQAYGAGTTGSHVPGTTSGDRDRVL